MLKCKICGCEFNAVKERHYISRDNGRLLSEAIRKINCMTHLIVPPAVVR